MAKMNDLSIEGVTDITSYGIGFESGVNYERLNIMDQLAKLLCDDHLSVKACTHSSCYAIIDLLARLAALN